MVNRKRGEVEFEAGGKTRVLRFTYNKIAMLEQSLGFPVTAIAQNLGVNTVMTALTIGLSNKKDKVSRSEAADILDEIGFSKCADIVVDAIMAVLNDEDEVEDQGNENQETDDEE